MRQFSEAGEAKLPIDMIGDVTAHWTHAGIHNDREFEAWVTFVAERGKNISSIVASEKVLPSQVDDLAFISDALRIMRPVAIQQMPQYVKRDDEFGWAHEYEKIENEVVPHIKRGSAIKSVVEGDNFSDVELIEIVEAAYASRARYLATGDKQSFWENERHYAHERIGHWDEAQLLEHMITVGQYIDETQGMNEYEKRINVVISNMAQLYADHGLVGRSIAMFSILTDLEEARSTLTVLSDRMRENRQQYGDEYYQQDYAYAIDCLRGDDELTNLFVSTLQNATIPLIEGAMRRSIRSYGQHEAIIEYYENARDIKGFVEGGEPVPMPYRDFKERVIQRLGEYDEDVSYGLQAEVEFDDLTSEAQLAIERHHNGRKEIDETDKLKEIGRLIFGLGYSLFVNPINDKEHYIHPISSDVEEPRAASSDVKALDVELLEETWLVTEYDGGYTRAQGYLLRDIMRIAPEDANAFWFAGNQRQVLAPNDQHITAKPSNHDSDGYTSRYVITPICFYKAKTGAL